MKKHSINPIVYLAIIFIMITLSFTSQPLSLEWQKEIGGSLFDQANAMCIEKNGNIFLTGFFQGEVSNNGVVYMANGDTDFFLTRLSKFSEIIWLKQGGGDIFRSNIATEMGT